MPWLASATHPLSTRKPPEKLDWFETLMHTHSWASIVLCCWRTEKERNFPKRKTLLEHVNFKTTFHVHFSFESFSYFREKLFFKNWRDGKTNFHACSGREIFRESVVAWTRVGVVAIVDRASWKSLFRKGFGVCSGKNYVTLTKYIRKLSYKHKPRAQKWFP